MGPLDVAIYTFTRISFSGVLGWKLNEGHPIQNGRLNIHIYLSYHPSEMTGNIRKESNSMAG